MEYSNPKIPEGINTSEQHPLKEFFLLSLGVLGIVVALIATLGLVSDKLAHHIPFSAEGNLSLPKFDNERKDQPINRYLESLTTRIVQASQLPDDMHITVHYVDSDVVNAFATLGGHVVMFRGLLEKLPNENALAMVLAHEVAHVEHRHPIRSMGRGIAIGLALTLVSSATGNDMVGNIINETGYITTLKFSRDHENEADVTALNTLRRLYGHIYGAETLFHILEANSKGKPDFEFLSTHPISATRIKRIRSGQETDQDRTVTALPGKYQSWLGK